MEMYEKKTSADDIHANVVEVLPDQEIVPEDGLQRRLKGRHVVFISLGSIIGPGTFYAIGYGLVSLRPSSWVNFLTHQELR